MKPASFPEPLAAKIRENGILAVLVIDDAETAVPLAEALLAGGIRTMELTLRTPAAMAALARIVKHVPEMCAGIGTILEDWQVREAQAAGAAFGLAPGTSPGVLQAAAAAGFPFIPGVATPSDIEAALGFGCRLLKFFPAASGGGLAHLESMSAPYAHLGLRFIPLGGVDQDTFPVYLKHATVAAVGGSWIARRDEIAQRRWGLITDRASRAVELIQNIRGGRS